MSRPPRLPTRLLAAWLGDDDREAVLAELGELFEIRSARHGEARARRWYTRQVGVFLWHLARHGRQRGTRSGASAFQRAVDQREREWRGGVGMGSEIMREIAQAVRRLFRAPAFTVVSVATIGVGIGAFTAIFGLVESVLLEDLPYEEPDELVWVWRDYVDASFPRGWLGGPDIAGMREQSDAFVGVAAIRSGTANLTTADGTDPARVYMHRVSDDFFDILGVPPLFGRGLLPEDDFPDASPVAVLAHDFWLRAFGADRGLVGRTIFLDGAAVEVVGVMPETFRFVKHGSLSDPLAAEIYVPLREDVAAQNPGAGMYAGLARLRPNVGADRLEAALAAAALPTNTVFTQDGGSPIRLWAVGAKADLVDGVRPVLLGLAASAGFLLLVLAANLTTLFLGRAALRSREIGIRAVLGAGRRRLVGSALGESVVIAVAGGVLGLVLARFGIGVIVALAPADLPRLGAVGLDGSSLAVAVAVTALMAVGAGLAPAWQGARGSLGATFEDDPRSGGSVRGTRIRGALVAVQVALSLMLLVAGGMTSRAFVSLLGQDPGFDPSGTLTFDVPLPEALYPTGADQRAFHDAFIARVAALPGVEAVGGSDALPLTQVTNQRGVSFLNAPGNTGDEQNDRPLIDWFRVTPDYFSAAGHRLLEGRAFDLSDADTTTLNIVIDDVLAAKFFPDGGAIGGRAEIFGDTATVVGVVDQARLYDVHSDDRGQVYISFQRFPNDALSYAVRTSLEPESLAPAVRRILAEHDGNVPMSDVRTLREIFDGALGEERLSVTLVLAFALSALLLAVLGLYGVVSNTVTRRTQEIGVRMALGADPVEVVRMILRQGLGLAMAGALLGLVGALAVSGVVEGLVVGVDGRDPLIYGSVALGLVAVSLLATYLPARRATRIDPLEALRPQ